MAKGSRGGQGYKKYKGRGRKIIDVGGGKTIELDSPLKYGNDTGVNDKARGNIEAWEAKRAKNKIEYGYAVNEKGETIGEAKGGKGSVRCPRYFHEEGSTFTHIHPRENEDVLGGTFSANDLLIFARPNYEKTCRAVAKEGTYSISKGANFDGLGFSSFVRNVNSNFDKNVKEQYKIIENDYYNKTINFTQYKTKANKIFNNELVKLHNEYSAHQKEYGYTYQLEKRGK